MRSLFVTLPLVILGFLASINTSRAQVSSDGSLSTTVTSPDGANFTIENGNRAGGNLFHSFSQFSVPTGGSAVFQNPVDVQNIISRVTGGSISNIDGLIRTQGSANLFLLNPAGIIFAPNARLDVGGSFFATTANSLLFPGGVEFSATNLQTPPVLSINIPIGLRFRDNPGNITNQPVAVDSNGYAEGLQVRSGKTLALVGGNVNIDLGILVAPGGRIELGGLTQAGTVGLNPDNSLSFADSVARGDISITNGSAVDVSPIDGDGGDINIQAKSFSLSNNARLISRNNLLEDDNFATGNAGDINITTTGGSVFLTNGASIISSTSGEGNAGNLTINTGDLILQKKAIIDTSTYGAGNGGDITINVRKLISQDGSVITSSTYNTGKAGDLTVHASESVELSGDQPDVTPGGILAQADLGSKESSSGGTLTIETKYLSISDGSKVQVATFGRGDAGNLIINAQQIDVFNTPDAANYYSTGIFAGVQLDPRQTELSRGAGGNLTIKTESLRIRNGGRVDTSTLGIGKAGDLKIAASDLVEVVDDSGISADVQIGGMGNAGNLTINTKKLVVRNSQVGTSVLGKGNAGTFTVNASESIEVKGRIFFTDDSGKTLSNPAGLFAQVNIQGEGKGGNLFIETPYLSVSDGAKVQVATFGLGDAGNLFIRASEIDVSDPTATNQSLPQAGIFAGVLLDSDQPPEVPLKGNGGTVTIETDRLRVRDGGRVSVLTQGDGDAGILQIRAKDSIEVFGTSPDGDVSEISANATSESTGSAGSLTINTRKLTVRDRGRVNVSNGNTKQAGNLEINANSIKLDNQGSITATSKSGNGGNITLNLRDYLLMRRNSEISTSAGTNQTGGNGGNITINTPDGFVVAFPSENSDITANAFTGKGGNVQINATGIYGIQFRDKRTPNSDITASSEFGSAGTVKLNTPDINPSQGLTELPENVTDPSDKIAENACQRGVGSTFVVTGRGGLPSSPNQSLKTDNVRVDLVEPTTNTSNSQSAKINQPIIDTTSKQIIPARGWVYNNKGEVVLTAYDPTATNPQRISQTTAGCPAPF